MLLKVNKMESLVVYYKAIKFVLLKELISESTDLNWKITLVIDQEKAIIIIKAI